MFILSTKGVGIVWCIYKWLTYISYSPCAKCKKSPIPHFVWFDSKIASVTYFYAFWDMRQDVSFWKKSTTLRNHSSNMVSYMQFKTEGSTLCMQKEVSVFDSWDSAPGPLFLKRKGLIQTDVAVSAVKLNLPNYPRSRCTCLELLHSYTPYYKCQYCAAAIRKI